MDITHWYISEVLDVGSRVGRWRYFLYHVLLAIPVVVIGFALGVVVSDILTPLTTTVGIALLVVTLLAAVGSICLQMKRFHDFGAPGWSALIYLAAIVALYVFAQPGSMILTFVLCVAIIAPFVVPGRRGEDELTSAEAEDHVSPAPENRGPQAVAFAGSLFKRRERDHGEGTVTPQRRDVALPPRNTSSEWEMIVTYDPKAAVYFAKATSLDKDAGDELIKRVIDSDAETRNWDAIYADVQRDFENRLGVIARDPRLLQAYRQIENYGAPAVEEFRKAVKLVGPQMDIDRFMQGLNTRYGSPRI